MEGAIALNYERPALRQVGRVRGWCWRASFWLDIFECLLQLVSNLHTVLYQASIMCQNSQQLTKSAELYQNEKEKGKGNCTNMLASRDMNHRALQ